MMRKTACRTWIFLEYYSPWNRLLIKNTFFFSVKVISLQRNSDNLEKFELWTPRSWEASRGFWAEFFIGSQRQILIFWLINEMTWYYWTLKIAWKNRKQARVFIDPSLYALALPKVLLLCPVGKFCRHVHKR